MSAPTRVYRTCESATSRLPTRPSTALRKARLYRSMLHDLTEQSLGTVSPPALQGTERHIMPKDLKYIGSYNWIDAPTPTIIVPGQSYSPCLSSVDLGNSNPGSPPIWVEKPTPLTIPRDSGTDFIDQNSHRMEKRFTLLPLIGAVQTCTALKKVRSRFDWPSVDFVADRICLRKFVAWANSKPDHWRIDTQLAGNKTVLMTCWLPATKQTSGWSDSYGFSFEKAFTHPAPGCESGTGHHRIVAYVSLFNDPRVSTPVLIANSSLAVSRWSFVSKLTPACPFVLLPTHAANHPVPGTTRCAQCLP